MDCIIVPSILSCSLSHTSNLYSDKSRRVESEHSANGSIALSLSLSSGPNGHLKILRLGLYETFNLYSGVKEIEENALEKCHACSPLG